jgi:hypothetical protein
MKLAVFWVVAPCSLVERLYNPEDSHLRTLRREKLKSYYGSHNNRLVSRKTCPSGEIEDQPKPLSHKEHVRLFLFHGNTFYNWGCLPSPT